MTARKPLVLAALVAMPLGAVPLGALAQDVSNDLSYTSLEADYAVLDLDPFNNQDIPGVSSSLDDGNGYAVRGSFAFTRNVFAFADYIDAGDADATFSSEDFPTVTGTQSNKRLNVGLGAALPLGFARPTDAVLRAAYVDFDWGDFHFGGSTNDSLSDLNEDSSDGFMVDASLRSQLTSWLEGSIGVGYLDVEDSNGMQGIGNLMVEVTPNWGVNLAAEVGSDVSTYLLGVRYSFNRF